jgi:hypothetical protein
VVCSTTNIEDAPYWGGRGPFVYVGPQINIDVFRDVTQCSTVFRDPTAAIIISSGKMNTDTLELPLASIFMIEGDTDLPDCSVSHPRGGRLRLKCDGTRAETRFRLSAKRTSPFKSAGASVQSTTGSRGVRISGSNAGYTMFRGSVKSTGYPLHSPVSPSLPLPCVTVCLHISTGL